MSGAILETYVFSEILKSYYNTGVNPFLYFYRDKDQKEIDFIIEVDQCLHPVECKKTAIPFLDAAKNFSVLDRLYVNVGQGVVFCFKERAASLSKNITALPISYI